ncbi:MAG: hypothetical protein ACKPCM_02770 [Pseudanabaena sp.]
MGGNDRDFVGNLKLLAQVMFYRTSLKDMVMAKQEKLEELGSEKYLQQM